MSNKNVQNIFGYKFVVKKEIPKYIGTRQVFMSEHLAFIIVIALILSYGLTKF